MDAEIGTEKRMSEGWRERPKNRRCVRVTKDVRGDGDGLMKVLTVAGYTPVFIVLCARAPRGVREPTLRAFTSVELQRSCRHTPAQLAAAGIPDSERPICFGDVTEALSSPPSLCTIGRARIQTEAFDRARGGRLEGKRGGGRGKRGVENC